MQLGCNPARQVEADARHYRRAVVFVAGQEQLGFFEAALEDAQVGEFEHRVDTQGVVPALERINGLREFRFGVVPPPRGRQQAAVRRAAIGREKRTAIALRELGRRAAPVLRTDQIAGKRARRQQHAEDFADRHEVADLASRDHRHRLVELGHARANTPQRDAR